MACSYLLSLTASRGTSYNMKLPAEVERYGMRLPELLPAAVPTSSGGAGSALSDGPGKKISRPIQGRAKSSEINDSTCEVVRGGKHDW